MKRRRPTKTLKAQANEVEAVVHEAEGQRTFATVVRS
jgi:hypothetical protein